MALTIPSLLKWTGSKRSQAYAISQYIPAHHTYLEPFLGGGALLYLMARPGAVAGDIYAPLIDFWLLVQNNPRLVMDDYYRQWVQLQGQMPEYYYMVRERFNKTPNPLDLSFLMRTCVNGIARFNEAGDFNNSFYLSRPGMHPQRFAGIVQQWHERIRGVRFACQDYSVTLTEARADDFVYLDPPYVGNKLRYVSSLDTDRLYAILEDMNGRGIRWALSFDGWRGSNTYATPLPKGLYRQRITLGSGYSAVGKVLNHASEHVYESLYLNYDAGIPA